MLLLRTRDKEVLFNYFEKCCLQKGCNTQNQNFKSTTLRKNDFGVTICTKFGELFIWQDT